MLKTPLKILPSPLSIDVDQLVLNVMSNLIFWYFNVFAFRAVIPNSFNTSSFWCECRINHCIEFITAQKFLVSFPSYGVLYRRCRNNLSLNISHYFHKTTNQPWIENLLMAGLKDCKSFQWNVSLSLAKKKLAEKNEWKFSNQSVELMYASIYPNPFVGYLIQIKIL